MESFYPDGVEDDSCAPALVGTPQRCFLEREPAKVPITILTGFLGAGKSTLLNRILSSDAKALRGCRFAVIMNEFGDSAAIERAVSLHVTSGRSEEEVDWLELPNGCLCCTIKTTAMAAIEDLLRRKAGMIDYVLLETTGLADPYPIVESFWADDALECRAYLDAIVCVIDAKNFSLRQHGVALKQVALADTVLVNKTDLVSMQDLAGLRASLEQINPLARFHLTQHADLGDLRQLLWQFAYRDESCMNRIKNNYSSMLQSLSMHEGPMAASSLKITVPRAISRERLERWLFSMLWERMLLPMQRPLAEDSSVLRVKGLLSSDSGKGGILVQAVQDLYEITEVDAAADLSGILILLGTFPDAVEIKESFYAYVLGA